MTRRIFKIISVILICVLVLGIIYISIPFTGLFTHSIIEGLNHDPSTNPKPQITHGEFPVELTYTINDKTIEISDVYICEYTGYIESIDFLEWDGYMKSTKQMGFLLYDKGNIKVFCFLGHPGYYMGELQENPYPVIIEEKGSGSGTITEEELLKNYGIELKDWKTASPIKNSFEEFEKRKTGDKVTQGTVLCVGNSYRALWITQGTVLCVDGNPDTRADTWGRFCVLTN